MGILQYLIDNFEINWRRHADAPIPSFNEEKINIYEFNHHPDEPLRNKDCSNIYVQDDYIMLYWLCYEEWRTSLDGMQKEIKRWAEYWVRQYRDEIDVDSIKIKVKVEDQDGRKYDSFIIEVKGA